MNDLHSLALQLAPELSEAELHLLAHQPAWPVREGVSAYCIAGQPLHVRDYLKSIGQWDDWWGSYVIFCEPPSICVLLHELSHLLPARSAVPDFGMEATDEQREQFETHLLQMTAATAKPDTEPWRAHDARFIRRAAHLAYRAAELGVDVRPCDLNVAGYSYALSHFAEYQEALSYEPMDCRFQTFAQIEKRPMPDRFLRLFCDDVLNYHRNQLLETYAQ